MYPPGIHIKPCDAAAGSIRRVAPSTLNPVRTERTLLLSAVLTANRLHQPPRVEPVDPGQGRRTMLAHHADGALSDFSEILSRSCHGLILSRNERS